MIFEILPTVEIMLNLYKMPRSSLRFDSYLRALQGGTKGDLIMPIMNFNPMGREHVAQKLSELNDLCTSDLLEEIFTSLEKMIIGFDDLTIKVGINLSDDLMGGWTNRFTSDYDSKFRINALVQRQFCAPIFWTSEEISSALVKKRVTEYVLRYIYWLDNSKPSTLEQHLDQEIYVAGRMVNEEKIDDSSFGELEEFYLRHVDEDNYQLIFNFFYGDAASESLGFGSYGNTSEQNGFDYAKYVANGQR